MMTRKTTMTMMMMKMMSYQDNNDNCYDEKNSPHRGEKCKVKLGGREVTVTTHTFTRPGGVVYIASAFIDW